MDAPLFAKVYDPLDIRRALLEAALLSTDLQEAGQHLLESSKEKDYLRNHLRQMLVESTNLLGSVERVLPPLPQEYQGVKSRIAFDQRLRESPLRLGNRVLGGREDLLQELAAIKERIRRLR